ncbi:MAG: YbaB/EbfC family nucleoid-associated protein [bacterium]
MNIKKMMREAQKVQQRLMEIQEAAAQKTVEATAGGGMVTVVANGAQEIVDVKIEREVVDSEDIEMLEDLVLAAVNEALRLSKEMVAKDMEELTGGLPIPGLSGLV